MIFTDLLSNVISVLSYTVDALSPSFENVLGFYVTMVAFFAAVYLLIDLFYYVGVKKK